jgi:hypothetical protein
MKEKRNLINQAEMPAGIVTSATDRITKSKCDNSLIENNSLPWSENKISKSRKYLTGQEGVEGNLVSQFSTDMANLSHPLLSEKNTSMIAELNQVQNIEGAPTNPPKSEATPVERDRGSPIRMDKPIQKQGQNLQEVLRLFREAHTTPLSNFIMQTPQHKLPIISDQTQPSDQDEKDQMQSSRFKGNNKSGKTIVKMAQDLIAKKWGIAKPEENLVNLTLQHYLDVY